ncbi:hypothetical protein GS538_09205 [Rhodococcus hoagii]|nr:hypothetical protein [Prescottella equi]
MALYTAAAYFHIDGEEPPRLTGSGVQLTHAAAATILAGRIITDAQGVAVGPVAASITEDTPEGSVVLFSAEGTPDDVLAALGKHRTQL